MTENNKIALKSALCFFGGILIWIGIILVGVMLVRTG